MISAGDLGIYIESVARRLYGKPNKALATNSELRFGSHGSLAVKIAGPKRGTWYDHENQIGGGVREMLTREGYTDVADWFRRELGIDISSATIIATYSYPDENGKIRFQVVRLHPKDFRQRRPDGAGGWIWNMKGVRLVPYRLPHLIAASRGANGQPWRVYIVEGEKDVDRLANDWGVVATTNPGGAGKWRADYGNYLVGSEAVIVADNDYVGRKHAEAVARALAPFAAVIKVLHLSGLPEKGDISDWINAGGTQSTIDNIINATDSFKPDKPAPASSSFRDPWSAPPQPEWPADVLPVVYHDMIYELAHTSGADPGALGMAVLVAVSGAAPKNAVFLPKGGVRETAWCVPPVLWVMVDAPSGQRKTALNVIFSALKHKNTQVWREYRAALRDWQALPREQRKETDKPREPHSYIVIDTTPEKLQHILAETDRGTLLLRDELAAFFGFGRYANDRGTAERSFYLESYEGGPYTTYRATKEPVFIEINAVTIFGHIQPERLAKFRDLTTDGLLQRFVPLLAGRATVGKPLPGKIRGKAEFDAVITQLTELDGHEYRPYAAATIDIISKLEDYGVALAELTDYGPGFQGFCGKLHGTGARIAFLLHLLEYPDPELKLITTETVARADKLVREFVLPHARNFYATVAPEPVERTRDIASWLLTDAPARIRASDFGKHVRACRGLSVPALNEALDPLVGGGWLHPETLFPADNAWALDLDVRAAMAHRVAQATERRERNRRLAESIGRSE